MAPYSIFLRIKPSFLPLGICIFFPSEIKILIIFFNINNFNTITDKTFRVSVVTWVLIFFDYFFVCLCDLYTIRHVKNGEPINIFSFNYLLHDLLNLLFLINYFPSYEQIQSTQVCNFAKYVYTKS